MNPLRRYSKRDSKGQAEGQNVMIKNLKSKREREVVSVEVQIRGEGTQHLRKRTEVARVLKTKGSITGASSNRAPGGGTGNLVSGRKYWDRTAHGEESAKGLKSLPALFGGQGACQKEVGRPVASKA